MTNQQSTIREKVLAFAIQWSAAKDMQIDGLVAAGKFPADKIAAARSAKQSVMDTINDGHDGEWWIERFYNTDDVVVNGVLDTMLKTVGRK